MEYNARKKGGRKLKTVKETHIIIHNSDSLLIPERIDGNAKYLKIILLNSDGSTRDIFIGSEFSEEKWKKRMEIRGEKPYLELEKI